MRFSRHLHPVGLGLLVVAFAGQHPAAAQNPTPKPKVVAPAPKVKHASVKPTNSAKPPKPGIPESFKAIATKLNTTPQTLETQFEAAHAANPKLTHGQFVSANVVAQNLGTAHPNVTVQAILDGLKSGKSLGQTLQSLKLSPAEAKAAEEAAEREVKAAKQSAKEADKAAEKPKKP